MRSLTIAFAVGLSFLLAACGGTTKPTASQPTATVTQTVTATPSAPTITTSPSTSSSTSVAPSSSAAPKQIDLSSEDLPQFLSPSGKISCLFDDYQGVQVRCDVLGAHWKVKAPNGCPLEYGDSVTLAAKPVLTCHGDTVFSPDVTLRLAYGQTAKFQSVTCTSATTGITCRNSKGAGFTVAKAGYRFLS